MKFVAGKSRQIALRGQVAEARSLKQMFVPQVFMILNHSMRSTSLVMKGSLSERLVSLVYHSLCHTIRLQRATQA